MFLVWGIEKAPQGLPCGALASGFLTSGVLPIVVVCIAHRSIRSGGQVRVMRHVRHLRILYRWSGGGIGGAGIGDILG